MSFRNGSLVKLGMMSFGPLKLGNVSFGPLKLGNVCFERLKLGSVYQNETFFSFLPIMNPVF